MRIRLFIFLLLFPVVFSAAQESKAAEPDTAIKVQVTESITEDTAEPAAVTEPEPAANTEIDTVTSASWKPIRYEILWSGAIGRLSFLYRLGIAFALIIIMMLLIKLIWFLFKRLNNKLESQTGKEKIKPLYIHKYKVLTSNQVIEIIEVVLRMVKYFITAALLILSIPFVFSFFGATSRFASLLFGYILDPIKDIAISFVMYIPNLFKIIIFVIITRYVIKALKFFSIQIEKEKLRIPGFYTEWAAPTYKIFQVLLWAFTVAIVYPYLPGSDSQAFRGVSVFVGIIFSIGSSSAIGNLVAGLVITYMRPFKIGDRVNIKDITGFVVEKNLMVVRLKTHKNEYVTFPNLIILGSNIINYNTSSDEDEEG